tara:strand:+ start:38 stop:697 length:660 start_codon:yes stop_codon:yes gene_type:complete
MKTVSIIITNYNRDKFIDRAIRSCLDQSHSRDVNIEIIVVDDASTDSSLKLLSMFKKSIRLIKHKKNKGVAAASNSGIKKCKGDFILRLDADDFLNKYSIQTFSSILLENPQISFVYSDHFRVDDKGFKEKKTKLNSKEALYDHGAGIMFRREIFDKIGFYNETLKNCEDYDFLIRVEKKFKGYYLPIPLYRYHIHGKNISLKKDRDKFKSKVRRMHGI